MSYYLGKRYNVYRVTSAGRERYAARIYVDGRAIGVGTYPTKSRAEKAGQYAATLLNDTRTVALCRVGGDWGPLRKVVADKFGKFETCKTPKLKVVK